MKEYYVKSAQAILRYHDLPGQDTPILFIHGLGCAGSFDYPEVAAQHGLKKHRCILIDLLGAGYSDKPEAFDYSVASHANYLKEFTVDIGLTDFILFGHSLGGAIAIELAALCRDMVSTLVLSESNLDPSGDGSISKFISAFSEDDFVNTEFRQLVIDNRNNGNTMWAATLLNWSPKAAHRISKSAAMGGSPCWREVLYRLSCGKSLIFGKNSLPDRDVDELKRHGIHIEFVADAGHSMAWENPAGLSGAIMNSIDSK